MKNSTIVSTIVLFVITLSYSTDPVPGNEMPDTSVLLKNASEALSRFNNVSQKITIESISMNDDTVIGKKITKLTWNRNNDKVAWKGAFSCYDADENLTSGSFPIREYALSDTFIKLDHFHERRGYWFASGYSTKKQIEYIRNEKLENLNRGGAMDGILTGNANKNVIDLIAESPDIILHDQTELIKGISCYVLEAKTDRGLAKAWVASDHGYSTLKWTINKSPETLHWDGKTVAQIGWIGIKAEFEFDKLEKVNNEYIIMSGQLKLDTQFKNEKGNAWHLYKYKRSDVDLNPDFESLEAFKMDLPENTVVWGRDTGANYQFINGKLIPFIDEFAVDLIDDEMEKMMSAKLKTRKEENKEISDTSLSKIQIPDSPKQELLEPQNESSEDFTETKTNNNKSYTGIYLLSITTFVAVIVIVISINKYRKV